MRSKLRLVFSLCLLFLVFSAQAQQSYWSKAKIQSPQSSLGNKSIQDKVFYDLDGLKFSRALEKAVNAAGVLYFPNESGVIESYTIGLQETLSEGLQLKFPNIRSYKGLSAQGSKVFFSFSSGTKTQLSATFMYPSSGGFTFLEKSKNTSQYTLYTADNSGNKDFTCDTFAGAIGDNIRASAGSMTAKYSQEKGTNAAAKTTVKTYRLAVAASGEYTQYHGGTVAGALAAINATVTRINAVFGRDLGVQLSLVASTTNVIYTDPETDPFGSDLNNEIQATLTANIGEAQYDIGHLFHQDNNNGNAGFVGAVCQDNKKGSGFSSGQFPEGDTFDIDFVAHEIGHQFGANHSWSYESEGTNVQVEPGSGSTIMSYAGIVSGENVAPNASDYFHGVSILQILNYLDTYACENNELSTNDAPVLEALSDYKLPLGTPFLLEAKASDPNAEDVLSYTWEQADNGVVTAAIFGPQNPVGAAFRSLPPTTSPQRYFPKLINIAANKLTTDTPSFTQWETLASIPRDYNFYVTVRDNASEGAGINMAKTHLSVQSNVGPFFIRSQDSLQSYGGGQAIAVRWEVARTNGPELNTKTLKALLSLDGGLSFSKTLATGIPNNGAYTLVLPNTNATNARLMLKAENNPFFAVNTADFEITQAPLALVFNPIFASLCPDSSLSLSGVIEYNATAEASEISFLNLPSGLSATPTFGTLSHTQTLDIAFSAAKEVVAGTYSITALVESGTGTNSLDFSITILPDTLDPPLLLAPQSGNTAVFLDATLEWSAVKGASTYKVEVSETTDFKELYYSNSTAFSQDYLVDLAPDTTYFWRVIALNDCGGNSLSEVNSFTTAAENTQTKSADLLPITIGSNDPNTINARIEFKEDLPLSSLEVSLDIAHSYLSDLVVKLYAPSGKVAVLIANSCGQGENLVATFSDTAPAFNCGNDPAIEGLVKPLGSFDIFRGDSVKGIWRLEIEDVAEADGGRLNLFEMKVSAAGTFRPDADNDGVYDDGPDQCLNTPAGVPVDTKGCAVYRLDPQNFRVSLKSQSCLNVSDGSVEVTVAEVMDYVVYVKNASGAQINQATFTSFLALENMTAANYTLCFEGTKAGITYEQQCFEVRIGAPEPLAVTTAVSYDNGGFLSVNLSGSSRYFVTLNGQSFSQEQPQLSLALKPGINSLKVATGLDCQGVYEEQIFYTPKPVVYPNPLKEALYIQTAEFEKPEMKVHIFTLSGAAMGTYNSTATQTPWRLDTSRWDPGVYIVRIELDGTTTSYKVLKE